MKSFKKILDKIEDNKYYKICKICNKKFYQRDETICRQCEIKERYEVIKDEASKAEG